MNSEKGREIIEKYRGVLKHVSLEEGPMDGSPCPDEELRHCHSMLDRMDGFLNKIEKINNEFDHLSDSAWQDLKKVEKIWGKFNRWLGFMQGIFWSQGVFTLDEMKGHNRS